MRKLSVALVAIVVLVLSLQIGGAAAKPAPATLTIQAFSGGVSGSLAGASKQCSDGRKIVVYDRAGGKRDPSSDQKVGSTRTAAGEDGYSWRLQTGRDGALYAATPATKGCAEVLSGVAPPPAALGADPHPQYPSCTAYVSESIYSICYLTFNATLTREGIFSPCRFGDSSGGCPGSATGSYPWAQGNIQVSWHQAGSVRAFEVSTNGSSARLDGTIPNSGSDRFTVTSAFANNEYGADRFFTPNLPGQNVGEVGGPLALNFQNHSGDPGASAEIYGYLFLKR